MNNAEIEKTLIARGKNLVKAYRHHEAAAKQAEADNDRDSFDYWRGLLPNTAAHIDEICAIAVSLNIMSYDDFAEAIH